MKAESINAANQNNPRLKTMFAKQANFIKTKLNNRSQGIPRHCYKPQFSLLRATSILIAFVLKFVQTGFADLLFWAAANKLPNIAFRTLYDKNLLIVLNKSLQNKLFNTKNQPLTDYLSQMLRKVRFDNPEFYAAFQLCFYCLISFYAKR